VDALQAVLDLDRLARQMKLATLHGADAEATRTYGAFLDRLQCVAEMLGLDWLNVLDAIEADARSDAFA